MIARRLLAVVLLTFQVVVPCDDCGTRGWFLDECECFSTCWRCGGAGFRFLERPPTYVSPD